MIHTGVSERFLTSRVGLVNLADLISILRRSGPRGDFRWPNHFFLMISRPLSLSEFSILGSREFEDESSRSKSHFGR